LRAVTYDQSYYDRVFQQEDRSGVTGGVTQTERIRSGGSYLSQSDFRVHFGLGTAKTVDSVEIRWPSGASDVVRNVAADHFYYILQGQGLVKPEQIRPTH
jgi:enediyne biosynthesis protein E4